MNGTKRPSNGRYFETSTGDYSQCAPKVDGWEPCSADFGLASMVGTGYACFNRWNSTVNHWQHFPMIIGYTTGVYDLFHVGHLNLLRNARALCDRLVVGVTVDELVSYKHKRSVIPFHERFEIVRACRYVDAVVPQESIDKFEAWQKLQFNMLFVGDDWFASERWQELEAKFKEVGVRVVYFPYTKGTSSTLINETLQRLRQENTPSGS